MSPDERQAEKPAEKPAEKSDWPVARQEVLGTRDGFLAWVEYLFMRAFLAGLAILPNFLLSPLTELLARSLKVLDRRHARSASDYLRTVFPEETEGQIAARVVQAYRHLIGMSIRGERWAGRIAKGWDGETWREHVDVECSERARRAIDSDSGILIVSAHVGDWETGSSFVTLELASRRIYAVSRPPRNKPLSVHIQLRREGAGMRVLPRRGSMKSARTIVEAGGAIILLLDQRSRQKPVFAPFFGRRSRCDRSAGVLLRRLGVPIVFCAAFVEEDGRGERFRLSLPDAIFPDELQGLDPVQTATLVNQHLERLILQAPEQYFWLHDRYKGGEDEAEEEPSAGPAGEPAGAAPASSREG